MKTPLGLVFEIGYTIAIPAVVFALVGRWLDGVYATKPLLTAAGVLLSMPVAAWAAYRKIRPHL